MNGKEIGGTSAKSYFYIELTPGSYLVESRANDVDEISITVAPQQNYYIWQEIKSGIMRARGVLHWVDEPEGEKRVNELNLLSINISGADILPLELDSNLPEKE